MPVVTSSFRSGSAVEQRAGNGVRSRIATTTSKPREQVAHDAVASAKWSWKNVTSASGASALPAASSRATPW